MKKKILLYMLCGVLSTSVFSVMATPLSQMVSYAHSGRTDSSGGHRDNKNKSGLGSYHYHCGGNPPHLHTGGVCPYGNGYSNSKSSKTSSLNSSKNNDAINENQSVQSQYGWKQNEFGWYYQTSESTYCQDGLANIGGKIYYFNHVGIMSTDWQSIEGEWHYFNSDGSMATGWQYINFMWYYLNNNGRMMIGWQTIENKQYYFYPDGHMATETVDINGTYYYLNPDGSLNENQGSAGDTNDYWDDEYDGTYD